MRNINTSCIINFISIVSIIFISIQPTNHKDV
jgi:hypothetical protein